MIRLFIIKFAAIILPVGLLIIITNYFVDPANLFAKGKYVDSIAEILSKGHNVDQISNYNERLLQEQMIKRLAVRPEVVVMGSSRIMEMGTDFFPGKIILNAGVSHANTHDLIAVIGLLDSLGKLPTEMIINVDPGLINNKGTVEWQSLYPYYNYFFTRQKNGLERNKIGNNSIIRKKLYSLVSFEYFKESLVYFFNGKSKHFVDVGHLVPEHYGRFSDGTISYPRDYLHPDTATVARVARATALGEGLAAFDTTSTTLFYSMLDFLENRKIKMVFVMLPYHPAYYETVNQHQQNLFDKYDIFFRQTAARRLIPVRGSFNATVTGTRRQQFYDMYHCSKEAVKAAFNKVL